MIKDSLPVLKELFRRDILAFWRTFRSRFFDTFLFFLTNAIVWGYFMPQGWMASSYGPFLIVGAIASFGLIDLVSKVSIFISDLVGDQTILHTLILPLRPAVLFAYIGFFWACATALITALLFPIGKILLFKEFNLDNASYWRLLLMFITINLFYGYFGLWVASLIDKMSGLEKLWARIIGPMWMLGAYFYSWGTAYKLSPLIGILNLANPMVYLMEGMRAAVLGQEGYLPFWLCMAATWLMILCFLPHAISRLKKRLDCV